ncbi:MAG: hypothetical protein IT426_03390 [Pirellulales bacterium]|nr:hypothetical protein [Pirellulales bacterium]
MAANQPVRGFSIRWQEKLSPAHFVKLEQHNREGKLLSENFYWRGVKNEDLQQLGRLPRLELDGQAKLSRDANRALVTVDPKNSTAAVALMEKPRFARVLRGRRYCPP